jgi:hypothetical protein
MRMNENEAKKKRCSNTPCCSTDLTLRKAEQDPLLDIAIIFRLEQHFGAPLSLFFKSTRQNKMDLTVNFSSTVEL